MASTARGNRIYKFSDNESVVAKASGSIPNVADPVTAESTALAQTSAVLVRGVQKLDVFIDVASNGAAAFLYVKFRFSDKESPSVSVPTDWGSLMVDNIDTATGISSAQEYLLKIDLDNVNGTANPNVPRRYCTRVEQVSGLWASALVYSDGNLTVGSVTFVRHS